MEQEQLLVLLEGLQEPAFFVREQTLVCGNAAFRSLGIEEQAPLEAFFSAEDPEGESFLCTVGGTQFSARTAALEEGTLYLLYPSRRLITTNALAHTAKNLRQTLQQMYSALDSLDAALPEALDAAEGSVSSMLQGIFRIERIADNLESLYRLESGAYKPCFLRMDLRELLTELLEEAEFLLQQAGIRLLWEVPNSTFVGSVDRDLLSLALWNLLSNAAQNAKQGSVKVSAERVRLTKLRIKVTDSGDGIAVNRQANLLERYETDPEDALEQSGIGIGLTIARNVARLHDGSFAVSMEQGNATTVALVLETNRPASTSLRSDIDFYQKSLDEGLVGLSEVLPRSAYDRRDILS